LQASGTPHEKGAPAGAPDLDRVIIILSHTTEPANIGATCRAMKTMGLKRLRLIRPLNPRGRTSRSLAHASQDVLNAAEVVDTLEEAVADVHVVAGTTSRRRQLRKHALLPPRDLAERLVAHTADGLVALLFGTERTGLTNDEVDLCRYLSTVDTAAPQPSLNLSQAVQLYAWEIRQAWRRAKADAEALARTTARRPEMSVHHPHRSTRLPTQFQLDMMYAHLARAMEALEYTESERRKFLTYLRQLHMRAGIVDWELQIYHLLANRILKAAGRPGLAEED
jgi:tRNA (cytidine32/uridine32-2'-O)-methyltransferase